MEKVIDKIKKISEKEFEKFKNDEKFIEYSNFLNEIKSKGLLKPNSYNLPPLDTIGKRLYQTK